MKKQYTIPLTITRPLRQVTMNTGSKLNEVPVAPNEEGNQNLAESREYNLSFSVWDDEEEEDLF